MSFLPLEPEKLYLTRSNKVVKLESFSFVSKKFIYTEYPQSVYETENGKAANPKDDIIALVPKELYDEFIQKVKDYDSKTI